MTDNFNYGDKISITGPADEGRTETLIGWVVPGEDEQGKPTGGRLFINFLDPHPSQGVFDFDGLSSDERLTIELVASLDEQLPTEPGQYVDAVAEGYERMISALDGSDYNPSIWVLNNKGEWTDPEGTDATADRWLIPVLGFNLSLYVPEPVEAEDEGA